MTGPMIVRVLAFFLVLFIKMPGKTAGAESTSRPPILHLVTISDNIDHTPRIKGMRDSHGSATTGDPGLSENDDIIQERHEVSCFNRDVASLTFCFIRNIPPEQLKIHHFVTDVKQLEGENGGEGLMYENRPVASDDLFSECNEDCRFYCRYGIWQGRCHLKYQPEIQPVGKLVTQLSDITGSCEPEKGDTIVVYYSGHGEWDAQEGLRYLIGGVSVRKDFLRNFIQIKMASRGTNGQNRVIFLSDCCSVKSAGKDYRGELDTRTFSTRLRCPRTRRIQPLFQHLFFSEVESVDFSAAREGYPAITLTSMPDPDGRWWNPDEYGGIFTIGLIHTLDAPRYSDVEPEFQPNPKNAGRPDYIVAAVTATVPKPTPQDAWDPLAIPALRDNAEWSDVFTQISERTDELFQIRFPHGIPANHPKIRNLLHGDTIFPDGTEVMRDHKPFTFDNLRLETTRSQRR